MLTPRRQVALALLVLAAGVWHFAQYAPAPGAPYPPCPIHALSGWHCPGCGSARAVHALVHGDFGAALDHNCLATLLLCALAPWGAWQAWSALRYDRFAALATGRVYPRAGWIATGAIALFTVARNLPWPPFSWLAPGG